MRGAWINSAKIARLRAHPSRRIAPVYRLTGVVGITRSRVGAMPALASLLFFEKSLYAGDYAPTFRNRDRKGARGGRCVVRGLSRRG